MRKTIGLGVAGAALAIAGVGALAAPAGAEHQHYIETPQELRIALPCEPDALVERDMHPRHDGFHQNPGQTVNAIGIATAQGGCEDPAPSGPAR